MTFVLTYIDPCRLAVCLKLLPGLMGGSNVRAAKLLQHYDGDHTFHHCDTCQQPLYILLLDCLGRLEYARVTSLKAWQVANDRVDRHGRGRLGSQAKPWLAGYTHLPS